MAKARSRWVCGACGATHSGWFGNCSACGEWNTIEERTDARGGDRVVLTNAHAAAVPIGEVRDEAVRKPCGLAEVDRVLGGGFVAGSVVLLGGPPGIGKSTLLLQVGASMARAHGAVLYVSGEESVAQVAGRATRLGAEHDKLLLMAETRTEPVLDAARDLAIAGELQALIVDSVQTLYSAEQEGLPGNVGQIRAVAAQTISFAKTQGIPVVLVGHVTKDGQLAGPRLLEHMVDAVLSFEGDDERATRLLRASKNRFGSTMELGVFEMTSRGLAEVTNPSEAFLAERPTGAAGSCVTATIEGSRPLLLEVQALLNASGGGNPRRNCVGVDGSRLAMLLAVLERHGKMEVSDRDVFVNVAGGMRLFEPASDLAVLLAVASSRLGRSLDDRLVAIGEVGLTGELRQATRLDLRLTEAARLGFRKVLIARGPRGRSVEPPAGLEVIPAASVAEALEAALSWRTRA